MTYDTKPASRDQSLIDQVAANYSSDFVIVATKPEPDVGKTVFKRVNVYVDGILQTMNENHLQRLIDIGFYEVVTRKPGGNPS